MLACVAQNMFKAATPCLWVFSVSRLLTLSLLFRAGGSEYVPEKWIGFERLFNTHTHTHTVLVMVLQTRCVSPNDEQDARRDEARTNKSNEVVLMGEYVLGSSVEALYLRLHTWLY